MHQTNHHLPSIHSAVLLTSVLCVAFVALSSSEDKLVTSSSFCPRHCECFTVSYSSPPQNRQLKQYMYQYEWEEGAQVVGCWGRGKIPQNVSPDTQYLLLLGNGKVKRRDKSKEDKKESGTIQSIQGNSPVDSQPQRKWRQIKTVADESFQSMRNLVQLDLSGNKVTYLNSNSFHQMRGLEALSLRHNRLKKLPKGVFQDLSKLTTLDLSGNNIRHVSADLFRNSTNLVDLDLSDNLLNYLPERSLHWLVYLQRLNISHNRLLDIPNRLLIDLIDLRDIHLNDNKIRVLGYDMFRKNNKIEVLSLKNNDIRTLEEFAFYYQNQLRRLDLSGNQIEQIPNTIFAGSQAMLWMDLSYNNISNIEDGAFARIENLTELNLSYNTLDVIDVDTLDELPKLRKLNLTRNNITTIAPGSLQGLKLLQVLDLSFNNLETIEAHTFYGLEELADLHLSDNMIKTLSPEAFKVSTFSFTSKLTWLNLESNELSFLEPHAFYGAPNVKVLNLVNNHINMIDKNSFHGLLSLKSLMLNRNNLRLIDNGYFHLLTRLETLDLSENGIETITSGSFQRLNNKLRELNLEDNYLNGNSFDWTEQLQSLQALNLNKNAMRRIPTEVFLNLNNLRTLTLAQNGIERIDVPLQSRVRLSKLSVASNEIRGFDQDIQRLLQPGSKLDLSYNPWNCDCALATVVNELKSAWRVTFQNAAETTCSTPRSDQYSLLYTLKPTDELCSDQDTPTDHTDAAEVTPDEETTHTPCQTTYRLPSEAGVWPWHAVLWNTISGKAMCNGALIGPNWVLSSLRCLEPHTSFGRVNETHQGAGHLKGTIIVPRHWVIKLGKSKNLNNFEAHEQIYSVIHVHIPPGDQTHGDWDRPILMELSSLASVSSYVIPICPADQDVPITETTVTGWASYARRTPYRFVSFNFTSAPVCEEHLTYRDYVCTEATTHRNIRYAVDANLGAPLVTHISDSWFVVGVVTDTLPEETKIIDVRPFYGWLHQTIAN
ncbi:uncharacterized protein [Amphiura filiformis]|uniref:uncharacterized protein n=1 Tax=Amphiura filiformis TaxID=82378 RepID=UPI003B22708E